jgi:hypothetical protein
MKKKKLALLVGLILIISTVTAFATGAVTKNIDVLYNNIKLVVDGKPIEFGEDSAGNKIEPFIYNGTTYLPVRAVGEAIGKKVDWDGSNQTVYLGEKPGEVNYMTEIIEPYDKHRLDTYKLNDTEKLELAGKTYKTGYRLGHTDRDSLDRIGYAYFNLDGKYSEIECIVGYKPGYNSVDRTLNIYLDGKLFKTMDFTRDSMPEKLTIPVSGVLQLKLEVDKDAYSSVIFADVTIK